MEKNTIILIADVLEQKLRKEKELEYYLRELEDLQRKIGFLRQEVDLTNTIINMIKAEQIHDVKERMVERLDNQIIEVMMTWANYNPIQAMLEQYHEVSNDDDVLIPTTDEVAWTHFVDQRWVYDKMRICASQDIPHGPIGTTPTEYPICVKPIYNLFGGSIKSHVCHNEEQYRKIIDPSLFWSPYHMGDHYSVDLIMCNGSVVERFVFCGEKLQHGAFDYWYLINDDLYNHAIDDAVRIAWSWAQEQLWDYTGCVNIEIIGTSIIEVQLRMGDIDRLGCASLMESIHNLYATNKWTWKQPANFPEHFYYSCSLWST